MKVLVADSQPTMRLGIKRALELEPRMQNAGEAANPDETLSLAQRAYPDVVVVDPVMDENGSGASLLKEIKALSCAPAIVVHTIFNAEEDVFASRLAGAESFVYKGEETSRLLEAVRETYAGKRVLFLGEERREGEIQSDPRLTPREKEIFTLLIRRYTNAEISQELTIGLQTVKNHVSNILKKLEAEDRNDLP